MDLRKILQVREDIQDLKRFQKKLILQPSAWGLIQLDRFTMKYGKSLDGKVILR